MRGSNAMPSLVSNEPPKMNTALHPTHKWLWDDYITEMRHLLRHTPYRWEHEMRAWEYGFALTAIADRARDIIDVGGGGSLFAPAAAKLGIDVVVIDPQPVWEMIEQQGDAIGKRIHFAQSNFEKTHVAGGADAVVCLSVIEHVPDHITFFRHLLNHVRRGGTLALTTDFHPSGRPMCPHHLRTYNEQTMREFINLAATHKPPFTPLGDIDYTYHGDFVNNYSFASLALVREE